MTQPTEAVGGEPIAPEPTLDDRLNTALGSEQDEENAEPVDDEPDDEPTAEEEADDLPPIDAPVSWDADAKERFAKLPREDQEYLSKREGERERFVQSKSQEATRARQEVEQAAHQQLAAYERSVSEQLSQFAMQMEVPKPDPALLATDPLAYAYQARKYDDAQAQRQHAQQTAQQYAEQARQREAYAEQAHHAEQRQIIVDQFPEYADPTTGPKLQQELSTLARDLGYPPELISQARATDILAMRKASEWKAKADKFDALNARKMEKVRGAKALPPIAKPGNAQAPGAARQNQYAADREAMKRGDKDATSRVLSAIINR